MIITLYGPDSYRRTKKLKTIVGEYRGKHSGLAYEVFDFEDEPAFSRFGEFAGTPSLFAGHKLAVVKNIHAAPSLGLSKILKALSSDEGITVLVSESALTKQFNFLLRKPNLAQEFKELSGAQFVSFLKKEAEELKIVCDESVLYYLASALAGDSFGAVNVLSQLKLFNSRPSAAVFNALKISLADDFWGLIRDWSGKQPSERLLVIETLFAQKEDPAKIFNLLAYQDLDKIKKFADYDVMIKSGKLDYEEALLELAIGI